MNKIYIILFGVIILLTSCNLKEKHSSKSQILGEWKLLDLIKSGDSEDGILFNDGIIFGHNENFEIVNDFLYLSGIYSIKGDTLSMISKEPNKIDFELRYQIEFICKTILI